LELEFEINIGLIDPNVFGLTSEPGAAQGLCASKPVGIQIAKGR